MFIKSLKKLIKKSKKRLSSIYKYFIFGINKFILILQKGIYLYECINDQKHVGETLSPKKEKLCSNLNVEGISAKNRKLTCKKSLGRT